MFRNHTFTCSDIFHIVQFATIINEPVKGSERFAKE
jgi:hypothetical protein